MLSIFSCAYWPPVCLLWRNVCLGLLPIFWFGCLFFCCWVVWAVCIFWRWKLYIMVSFAVQKVVSLIRFHLFLFLLLLPWETDQRKHWYDLCQRMFCLCSLLGVVLFSSWKTEIRYPGLNNSPFPPPLPLATTLLLSVPVILTTLSTTYKWSHTVFVFLRLAYFTQHNVLEVHPCCSMCENFLPF